MCDEPMHREEEGRPHQDVLAETIAYGDQPLCGWDVDLDGQDATSLVGRLLEHVAAMLGFFGTCDRLLEPQEGQRFAHWMVICPKRANVSPKGA
jgi:hypothetical protein